MALMNRRTFLALGATAPVSSESPVIDAARALRTLNDVPGMVAFNGLSLVDELRRDSVIAAVRRCGKTNLVREQMKLVEPDYLREWPGVWVKP